MASRLRDARIPRPCHRARRDVPAGARHAVGVPLGLPSRVLVRKLCPVRFAFSCVGRTRLYEWAPAEHGRARGTSVRPVAPALKQRTGTVGMSGGRARVYVIADHGLALSPPQGDDNSYRHDELLLHVVL